MANIIITSTGDKCLQLSGSEAFYRTMDVPTGSSDIRFGIAFSASGSIRAQQFNPAVSIFETFQIGFTSGSGFVPGAGSTNQHIMFRNVAVGGNSVMIGTVTSCSYMSSGFSVNPFTQNCVGGTPTHITDQPMSFVCSMIESKPEIVVVRLYKSGSNSIVADFRFTAGVNTDHSTRPNRTESQVDSWMHDCLTNLASTNQGIQYRIDFENTSLRDIAVSKIDSIFLGWPWYNIPLNIHAIGYRAI